MDDKVIIEEYIDQNKPIKGKNISEEKFNEILELTRKEYIKDKMKSERYKSYIYNHTPFPLWSRLVEPSFYQNIVSEMKKAGTIPNDDPEICYIKLSNKIDNQFIIHYQFQESNIKYELSITEYNNVKHLNTQSFNKF